MTTQPAFPVPRGRFAIYSLHLESMPEDNLPEGSLTFQLHYDLRGVPSVISATLRLLWPMEAEAGKSTVLDDAVFVVDFDTKGRIANLEATSYVIGPAFVPDLVALHRKTMRKAKSSPLLTAAGTIMRYWPMVDALHKRLAHGQPRSLATAKPVSGRWEVRTEGQPRQQIW